jgi:hypothetical protein
MARSQAYHKGHLDASRRAGRAPVTVYGFMFVGIPLLVLCFWAIVAMLGITCVVAVVQAF